MKKNNKVVIKVLILLLIVISTITLVYSKTFFVKKEFSISILKVNDDKVPLSGATLQVTDNKGKVIDEWTSDETKHNITKLKEGTSTLKELIAPVGYNLSEETITFTINKDGKAMINENQVINTIEFINTKKGIEVSVQNEANLQELPGAKLTIKNANGTEVITWTSSNKPHIIKGIPEGTYTLTEISPPNNYNKQEYILKFRIDMKGKVYDENGNILPKITIYHNKNN